jgi:hypothetical protein
MQKIVVVDVVQNDGTEIMGLGLVISASPSGRMQVKIGDLTSSLLAGFQILQSYQDQAKDTERKQLELLA